MKISQRMSDLLTILILNREIKRLKKVMESFRVLNKKMHMVPQVRVVAELVETLERYVSTIEKGWQN